MQAHRVAQKRFENNPIKKAEYYERLMQSTGASSIRQLAEITGEDWSYIAKLLKILDLPEGIREYLRNPNEPEVFKYFHLRRLLELVRLTDQDAQTERFCHMLQDATNGCSLGDK